MAVLSSLHGIGSTIISNLFITLPVPVATPDLPQQTIVVTGANTGLGLETSRHLLRLGVGKLIMGVRDPKKGEKAKVELIASTKRLPESVEVWHIDMEDYNSVESFAHRASTTLPRLDAVLANAGVMAGKFTLSNGIERTIAVNVVSTYLLFLLVLRKLRESPSAGHFAVPNSALHYLADVKNLVPTPGRSIFSRLNDPTVDDDMDMRYNISKLLVIYVTRELASRMSASGKKSSVIVNTPNPSYCKSGLLRETKSAPPPDFLARTSEMGSRALVNGLLAGPETNGKYLTNCHVQT
jgi:NAD(P)-dependent dehydrogenase (short-subunit alcohol dehydrogenase family)